jgi:hypothetical protein
MYSDREPKPGEIPPRRPSDRLGVRVRLIKRLGLDPTDNDELARRINEYVGRAKSLRTRVLKDPTDLPRYYRLLAYIVAAALLASGPLAERLRETCLRPEIRLRGKISLLRLTLKALGPYNYNITQKHRSNDKRLSRDYQAIQYAISKGTIPTELIAFFRTPGQGLDECSRRLSGMPRTQKSNVNSKAHLVVKLQRDVRDRIRALPVGRQFIGRFRITSEGIKLDGMYADPANVKALSSYAKGLPRGERKKSPDQAASR